MLSAFRITLFYSTLLWDILRYVYIDNYILLKVLKCGAGAG